MLVLEPIFEADFPSEIYAYRAGGRTQQQRSRGGGRATVPRHPGDSATPPRGPTSGAFRGPTS